MPRLSIITGYFNRSRWLEGTIQSILTQSYEDFELLVFDDASTDNSAQELDRLSEKFNDKRFRFVVHQENTGFTRGLIAAINATDSELIAIQGSGDISLPRRMERQQEVFSRRPEVGAVGCWVEEVSESGRRLSTFRPDASRPSAGAPFSHGELMMRRSVYEEAGGYRAEFKNAQDLDLYPRLGALSAFETVPATLYQRRALTDGMSFSPPKVAIQSRYGVIARRMPQLSADDQSLVLSRIRAEGIMAVVPATDPDLQKRFQARAMRIALWGDPRDAITVAEEIASPVRRTPLVLALRFYASPLGWVGRKVAPVLIGLKRRIREFRSA